MDADKIMDLEDRLILILEDGIENGMSPEEQNILVDTINKLHELKG